MGAVVYEDPSEVSEGAGGDVEGDLGDGGEDVKEELAEEVGGSGVESL